MKSSVQRRSLLLAATVLPLASACTAWSEKGASSSLSAEAQLAELERASGGRIGVAGLHTGSGARFQHRAHERFPMCSTFKLMLAAAVLERSAKDASLLSRQLSYGKSDLIANSPITEKHVATGMNVADLCAATIQYSDNAAANVLLKLLGGPPEVTAFSRRIGDQTFRLDRTEPELNTSIPGDLRDTTTPAAMSDSVQRLVLGDALGAPQRDQLKTWLLGNTTNKERFLAGVPAGWKVGDKTGGGSYGSNNDVGVLWPPAGAPLVLSVYLTFPEKDAKTRNDVVASATRIAVTALAG
ncbi:MULTISPECIES: class A beta-lactamase [unclassified Variovorax]|uniref:class A beta-lactamase n=1 Tax=unclassified Variovorax TaxID=663243 RepID=UPI0008B8D833|nr:MULTISPECIES: class A beta-lactamase [unclassified Variovorax]SEK09646.1 beta-lactamase class A [Variovorax sp. OK202]SFD64236.1 beta-lactamase class A [Variovorax sp. OK212]